MCTSNVRHYPRQRRIGSSSSPLQPVVGWTTHTRWRLHRSRPQYVETTHRSKDLPYVSALGSIRQTRTTGRTCPPGTGLRARWPARAAFTAATAARQQRGGGRRAPTHELDCTHRDGDAARRRRPLSRGRRDVRVRRGDDPARARRQAKPARPARACMAFLLLDGTV